MALLVLFSTFSFTVAQHYCGDVLVDYSLFGHAESCGMEVQEIAELPECNLVKTDCCSDEVLTVDGQNDLKVSFEKISFEQQSYLDLFEYENSDNEAFIDYSPPPLIRDVQVLDQTFLI